MSFWSTCQIFHFGTGKFRTHEMKFIKMPPPFNENLDGFWAPIKRMGEPRPFNTDWNFEHSGEISHNFVETREVGFDHDNRRCTSAQGA